MTTDATGTQIATTLGRDFQDLVEALLNNIQNVLTDFPDEVLNEIPEGLTNSPYTLIYHLLGSARYWIGEVVGGGASNRVRADEFQAQGSRQDLEQRLENTRVGLAYTFEHLDEADLTPHPVDLSRGVLSWGSLPPEGRTSAWVIAHDLAHMAYHLGQLRLMQRLLLKKATQ